jgi:tetratricopeptide (TPR) repeat protein
MFRGVVAGSFAIVVALTPCLALAQTAALASSGTTGDGLEDLRDEGYALKQRQDCARAYSVFLAAAKKSGGAAEDMLAAAECAIQLGRKPEAISEVRAAIARQTELSRDDRIEAITSLADLLEATPEREEAAKTWDQALQLADTPENRLGSARAWRADGNIVRADAMLATVDPKQLTASEQADYWSEKSEQLAKTDPNAALAAIDQAIALEDADYRRVARAEILGRLGRKQEAIGDLEQARKQNPKDADTALALAYAYNEAGRHGDAANAFEAVARLAAPSGEFLEDWAYALADAGRTDEADKKFRELIDTEEAKSAAGTAPAENTEAKLLDIRGKVKEIEQDFQVSANFNYRSDSISVPLLEPQIENGLGAEGSWRSPLGLLTPRDISLFGSLFATFDHGLSIDGDSTQGAAGVRWIALREPELSFSFERYVKIGSGAQDGWAVSANFLVEKGTDWNPTLSRWTYLMADASVDYLWEEPHAFSAVGEFRAGEAFSLGNHTMLVPHLLLAGQDIDNTGEQGSLLEAGAGFALRHWLSNDRYRGLGDVVELSVQYRLPLARDRLGQNGGAFVVQASLEH